MFIASLVALILLSFLAIFQITLIMGAPFGNFAWGGQYRVLPKRLRLASIGSIIVYIILAVFVLSKSGLWTIIHNETVLNVGLWAMTIYLGLGVVLNAISRSKRERNLMTPVAFVLTVAFLYISQ